MKTPALRIGSALLFLVLPCSGASTEAVRGTRGMVVCADALASEIGLSVLRDGGNAVDAAVATAFALAVTYPEAGNLGGGGFLLLRRADGSVFGLDFRETAPQALRPSMFLDEAGRLVPERSLAGGLAVGIPGSVAGLYEAQTRWGRAPWPDVVSPAIRLARSGFPLPRGEAAAIAEELRKLAADPGARALFTRQGAALKEGDALVQTDLAATLQEIASRGPRGFYRGRVAKAIVRTVRARGGVLTEEDLASYRPVHREPLTGSYRGHRIVAFPPPSSAGVLLFEILGMIEKYDLREAGFGSSRAVHLVAEAERRAFADRAAWLGDPDFVSVPLRGLLDPAYLASRGATIDPARATPSREVSAGAPPGAEPEQTTHLSAADADGNVVALTTTLNSLFGAAVVAEGTGVLLNNEIDDFSIAPEAANQYGLTGGKANALLARKRPLSTMCPTIVEQPGGGTRPLLVLGSRGGSTIVSSVLEVLVNVVDHRMALQEAVDAPRFHHQWLPDRIDHEARAFPSDVAEALRKRGHELHERLPIGDVQTIGVDATGVWLGAADPRHGGKAAGF